MRHVILTRFKFDDKELLKKYLKISKEVFIPSLKSQTNQNFELALIVMPEDIEFLKEELDFPFIPIIGGNEDFALFASSNNIQIQTRHDCDDWMSATYIQTIQESYLDNIERLDTFLIQSQPTKIMYPAGPETSLPLYHNLRCSMHLTLCQKRSVHHIVEHKHGAMHQVTPNIITLPEGYTKWVIHGDNISVNPNRKK